MSERPVIELHKFSKWYGRIIAVNELSLDIHRGVTGLLGPNGAGKTSLLRCISGQTRPSLGAVRVLGENPWRNPELFRNIGLCTDQGWLMDELTPMEMLSFDLRVRGVEEGKLKDRAMEALSQFDLDHAADRRINTLSRGTRQRVKLAQAFSYDPEVLLLDEPLTGIDPVARATTVKRIKERGAAGRCVLLSSHVLHEVESMTDQVLLLHKGRLVAHGNAFEIRDLLDKYPHRIAVECDQPKKLAKAMIDESALQGVSFPDDDWVEFHTLRPDECYASIPKVALATEIKVRRLTSPDATLEMLFRYLVGEGA